jgi:hypothetical protein
LLFLNFQRAFELLPESTQTTVVTFRFDRRKITAESGEFRLSSNASIVCRLKGFIAMSLRLCIRRRTATIAALVLLLSVPNPCLLSLAADSTEVEPLRTIQNQINKSNLMSRRSVGVSRKTNS